MNTIKDAIRNPVNEYLEINRILYILSVTRQPCDITFVERKPLFNVTISADYADKINKSLASGSPDLIRDASLAVELDNREMIDPRNIWVVIPLPKKQFTEQQLLSVDISLKNIMIDHHQTLAQFIAKIYQCVSDDETDYFVRRYLASESD